MQGRLPPALRFTCELTGNDMSATNENIERKPQAARASRSVVPGLLLTTGIAAFATFLNTRPGFGWLSPLILAVVIGIVVRNCNGVNPAMQPGITFSLKRILRLAVILLGLRIGIAQILAVGPIGLGIVTVTLAGTFVFTCWLGRQMGLSRKLVQLVAAGTSICGASAVVATSGAIESSDEDVAYAVTIVTIFGTLSMLLYPAIDAALQLPPEAYGIWCGASIHEVAQVVAAAFQMGGPSGDIATVAKLSRVVFLVPVLLMLGLLNANSNRQGGSGERRVTRLPIPWFVIGFIVLMLLNSLNLFPEELKAAVIKGNKFLLTIALAAMGLETSLLKMCKLGLKPLYLGAAAWLFISVLSFGLVTLAY